MGDGFHLLKFISTVGYAKLSKNSRDLDATFNTPSSISGEVKGLVDANQYNRLVKVYVFLMYPVFL